MACEVSLTLSTCASAHSCGGSVGHKSDTRGSSCSLCSRHTRTQPTPSPHATVAQQSIRLIEDDCSRIRAGGTFVAPHMHSMAPPTPSSSPFGCSTSSLLSEIAPSPSAPRRSWAAAMAVPHVDRSRPQARSPAAAPRRLSWAAALDVPRPRKRRRRTRRRNGALASTRGGSNSSWAPRRPSWPRRVGG